MNPAAVIAAIVELAKDAPELVTALAHVFSLLQTKQDPTPAVKHAQAVAEAIALGLDPKQV